MLGNITALIGGEGSMPRLIIDELHKQGRRAFLIAVKGSTPCDLEFCADKTLWINITQLGKAIKACCKLNIEELILAGRIKHSNVLSLSLFKMDLTSLILWLKLPDKRADTILSAVVNVFECKGIQVVDSVKYLSDYMSKKGVLTKKKPSKDIMKDIELGTSIARNIGGLDIGQTVVIKKGVVVAVEAMEGTDNCIQRAGDLAGEGCVVVKMAKPQQDMRFDVPTIGLNTLEKLHKIGGSAIAIEAEKTLIVDPDVLDYADEQGLVIVAL